MIRRLALVIVAAVAPSLFAQTYIVPDGDCGAITFHTTRGADFPRLGETIGADRVSNAYVFLARKRVAVKPADGAHSLDFDAHVAADDGVVMASVELAPAVSGNETRTEHAKAFIFCGASTPVADWQRSTGLDLEIIPQGWNGPRPHMKSGDCMRFIAVDKATRTYIRDLPMELYRADGGRIADGGRDPNGMATFSYPEPGRYMVVARYRRPDPKQPDHWLVDTSTLTFDIK